MNEQPADGREKVLWLTKGLGRGGVERLLVEAARRFDRDRFDIEVAYLLPWKDAFVGDLERAGVPVHCLRARSDLDPRWVLALWKLLRDRKYALVHAQAPVPAVVARLLCSTRGPRIVYTEHNLWNRYKPVTRWANALTYRRNRAVIAVSAAVAHTIDPPGRRPTPSINVILHGPDSASIPRGPAARAAARERLGLGAERIVVGTVGNLTAKKDHRTLLAAFAALDLPTADLVLVGTGPLRDELVEEARRLGLVDQIHLLGMRDDVYDLLAGFDVFVMSSRFEGLPIALLEAMSAQLPVVATAVGGVPEVVHSGRDGLLVAPGDPSALAAAMRSVLDDPAAAAMLAHAARKRAMQCDLVQAVESTEKVYDRVLGAAS